MPKPPEVKKLVCYFCGKEVPRHDHEQHEILFNLFSFHDVPGWDNMFVHMRGTPDGSGFDEDANVVVCDRDFVQEAAIELGDATPEGKEG